jgi:hypothetical protein
MTDNAEQELFESISKDVEKLDEDEAKVDLVKEPVVQTPADEVKPEPKPKKAKVKKAMSDTRRAQLLDNLKRGRETSLAKRRVKAEAKKKAVKAVEVEEVVVVESVEPPKPKSKPRPKPAVVVEEEQVKPRPPTPPPPEPIVYHTSWKPSQGGDLKRFF